MADSIKEFKPYVPADSLMKEFTPRAIILGGIFGVLFGAATVYLALKAGLTVSASIPIAVLAISLGKKLLELLFLRITLFKPQDRPENPLRLESSSRCLHFCF
jgi:uncharacterized oligopeptide transporter (OPT) family protein